MLWQLFLTLLGRREGSPDKTMYNDSVDTKSSDPPPETESEVTVRDDSTSLDFAEVSASILISSEVTPLEIADEYESSWLDYADLAASILASSQEPLYEVEIEGPSEDNESSWLDFAEMSASILASSSLPCPELSEADEPVNKTLNDTTRAPG